MAVTDTDTAQEIIDDALNASGLIAHNETPTSATRDDALRILNRMLKAWQNKGWHLWTATGASETATTDPDYTLTVVRPHKIVSVRWKNAGGLETSMIEMTRDAYDNLPNKTANGTPTQWYFDRQREDAVLYVWPVPAAVTTETLEITYHREIEDQTLAGVIDIPGEWYEAVVFHLALRIAAHFKVSNVPALLPALAESALADALGDDREKSVYFGCEEGLY